MAGTVSLQTTGQLCEPRDNQAICREFDFPGQQQVALKMHKLAGAKDEHYVWWAVVAVALQAKAATKGRVSALPADKLLQLADVMAAKQAEKGCIRTSEQLMLYIDILQVALTF